MFPYICAKTTSADFQGKICDVFDENLIILDNNGVKKAAEWHSIICLELMKPKMREEKALSSETIKNIEKPKFESQEF